MVRVPLACSPKTDPCAVAGAIDRIFGLDQAIESLADVSEDAMIEKYQILCRLCGYYRPIRENSQTLLSETWLKALERYRVYADWTSPFVAPP